MVKVRVNCGPDWKKKTNQQNLSEEKILVGKKKISGSEFFF